MYHVRYKGSHYEMGFHWGNMLKKHNHLILNRVPFEISQERIDFAKSCIPCYEKYFPEILDEIQGLADGQETPFEKFAGILFSIYAMPPEAHCSVFAISSQNQILLARNSDFLTEIEKLNMNVIYSFKNGDFYSFTGNTTAFIEIEDGVNQRGLAVGFTSVYPHDFQPGINAGMIVRLILEKCGSVQEALHLVRTIPIASSQTITLADISGDIALIECNCDRVSVQTGQKSVCAVNNFHIADMEYYNNPSIDNWFAEKRYDTMKTALREQNIDSIDLDSAKDILSGKRGFLCQYDRKTGKDTVWSVIYDLKNRTIYRAEGNPSRKRFVEDARAKI